MATIEAKDALSDMEQAENHILGLLQHSSGDGMTEHQLNAVFYVAHLEHARQTGKLLTYWPIIRTPNGPGIDRASLLLEHLLAKDCIFVTARTIDTRPRSTYGLKGEVETTLDQTSLHSVKAATVAALELSPSGVVLTISSRAWKLVSDGQPLDIFIDVPSESEYEEQSRIEREVRDSVRDALACTSA